MESKHAVRHAMRAQRAIRSANSDRVAGWSHSVDNGSRGQGCIVQESRHMMIAQRRSGCIAGQALDWSHVLRANSALCCMPLAAAMPLAQPQSPAADWNVCSNLCACGRGVDASPAGVAAVSPLLVGLERVNRFRKPFQSLLFRCCERLTPPSSHQPLAPLTRRVSGDLASFHCCL